MKAQKYSNNHKKGHFFKEKFSLFNLLANEKHKINIYFFFTICLGHKENVHVRFRTKFSP